MSPRANRAAAPLAIGLAAAALALRSASDPTEDGSAPPPVAAPCAEPVVALLGGLAPGATLRGWRVVALDCAAPRRAVLRLERGGTPLDLIVTPRGAEPHAPPRETARCAVFWSRGASPPEALPEGDIAPPLDALAERLRDAEGRLPLPEGW